MARYTITLSDKAVAGLQAVVAAYNDDNKTALTPQEWITLHLQELAIAPQLQATVVALQEQTQRDASAALTAAVRTARDELIASLG